MDASETVLKIAFEGTVYTLKFAKELAGWSRDLIVATVTAILRSKDNHPGRKSLVKLIENGQPLDLFTTNKNDLKELSKGLTRFGISFTPIPHPGSNTIDLLFAQSDTKMFNHVLDVLGNRIDRHVADLPQVSYDYDYSLPREGNSDVASDSFYINGENGKTISHEPYIDVMQEESALHDALHSSGIAPVEPEQSKKKSVSEHFSTKKKETSREPDSVDHHKPEEIIFPSGKKSIKRQLEIYAHEAKERKEKQPVIEIGKGLTGKEATKEDV